MRFSNTAIIASAERQMMIGILQHIIINTRASCSGIIDDIVDLLFGCTKNVQCQRFFFGIDILNNLIDCFIRFDRKNRSEDFFLHNGVVETDIFEQGR